MASREDPDHVVRDLAPADAPQLLCVLAELSITLDNLRQIPLLAAPLSWLARCASARAPAPSGPG